MIGGMLAISNKNPERIKAGKNALTIEACEATSWLRLKVEMSRPKRVAVKRKAEETIKRRKNEPLKGTLKKMTERNEIKLMEARPKIK